MVIRLRKNKASCRTIRALRSSNTFQHNICVLFYVLMLLSGKEAFGFAEDSTVEGLAKSSVHYDLTIAFARCLNASSTVAETIATYNQATDSGKFKGASLDFTSRSGPNNGYFHVPQIITEVDVLDELYRWAVLGNTPIPAGLSQVTPMIASLAGTDKAFGVYLHAVGDLYSHKACTDIGSIPHCGTGPAFEPCSSSLDRRFCDAQTAHQREFGSDPVLSENTRRGLQAIYLSMSEYFGVSSSIPSDVQGFIDTFSRTTDARTRVALTAGLCPKSFARGNPIAVP